MKKKIFNFAFCVITNSVNEADASEPSEMLIYDDIGKDIWSGTGISAQDFATALNDLPTDRDVNILVNSAGGDVWEGMTMRNSLLLWKNKTGRKVNVIFTGIAASTASWAFSTVADKVSAFTNSQVFVHEAMAFGGGYASDLRKQADRLDTTTNQIAEMYATYSGKSIKSFKDLMANESLMTAKEACDCGLVDEVISDKQAVRNFTSLEINGMKNRLTAFKNSVAQNDGEQQKNKTMKKMIIAQLNKLGIKDWEGVAITEATSDEHLEAALTSALNKQNPAAPAKIDNTGDMEARLTKLQKQLDDQAIINKSLTDLNKIEQTNRVKLAIDNLIVDDKITLAEKDEALALAMGADGERYLKSLQNRQAVKPGAHPVTTLTELVGSSFNEVQKFVLDNTSNFMKNFLGAGKAENEIIPSTLKEISNRGIAAAAAIKKHKNMLIQMFNANTIDAGLQRQIILQDMLEEFAVVLLPLSNFSAVFNNVPLEGTDEVDVPFYPLATDAGNSWDPAVGYAAGSMGGTVTNTRPVLIGGTGVASGVNAPAGTCRDRKWVGAQFSSAELARQPYLNTSKLMSQKANRLAVLIFQDFVSRVICAKNYGATVKAVPAAQFSSDDIADLWETATGANWPTTARALTLTHKYNTPLIKDPTYKYVLNAGNDDALRRAAIRNTYGFDDVRIVPNLDTYSPANEGLVGWINWMYAALFAMSPIMPDAAVRALLVRYDVVVNAQTSVAFEYRSFGDATLDTRKEVIEASYGGNLGVASALKRVTSL